MKNKIYKLSIKGLKETQKKIKEKKIFKISDDNYKEYEIFILKSLE